MKKGLKVKNIKKQFNGIWVVNGITAIIHPGKITAFVGPNGAGKTTLFHIITGELKPDSGNVFLYEKDITGFPPWKIARMGVGKQFQDVRVFENLTVVENVVVALMKSQEESVFWTFKNFYRIRERFKNYTEKAMDLLKFVGLDEKRNSLARELSFGQQKLLSFARLMAGDFKILLMDEPTAGVAPSMIKKIVGLLDKLVEEKGKTIAIIEHNLNVVSDVAHWVYFLHEGKVVFTGRTDHVLGHDEVREIYMGF